MDSLNYALAVLFILSLFLNVIQSISSQRRQVARLEAKVRYLFEKTGVADDLTSALTPAIREALAAGKKIEAIKLYRDATGSSLRESKDAVEKMMP